VVMEILRVTRADGVCRYTGLPLDDPGSATCRVAVWDLGGRVTPRRYEAVDVL